MHLFSFKGTCLTMPYALRCCRNKQGILYKEKCFKKMERGTVKKVTVCRIL